MARLIRIGDWAFDPSALTIERESFPTYQIDVELLRTSAEVLDWIFQLRSKTWFTPKDSHDLLEILYVVVDPQANLCSWGAERGPIDPAEAAVGARSRAREWAH